MQCVKPLILDNESKLVVPCGKCVQCRIARSREWAIRMVHESMMHKDSVFLTLTYNDSELPFNGELKKSEIQNYMKRLRKRLSGRKIKYYAVGEYGDLYGRPHYHVMLYGISKYSDYDAMKQCWNKGMIHVGTITYDSARYVAEYINKKIYGSELSELGNTQQPFALMSKGLGKEFALNKGQREVLENMNFTMHGKSVGMPRYYKKLFETNIMGENILSAAYGKEAKRRRLELEKEKIIKTGGKEEAYKAFKADRVQAEKNVKAKLEMRKERKI